MLPRASTSLPRILVQAVGETLLPIIPHVDDYACLICTSIAFKPIRLFCGHLFCVRCLVKMQKRGQGDCPMCRAPTVITADRCELRWSRGRCMAVDVGWQRTWIGRCLTLCRTGFRSRPRRSSGAMNGRQRRRSFGNSDMIPRVVPLLDFGVYWEFLIGIYYISGCNLCMYHKPNALVSRNNIFELKWPCNDSTVTSS